MKVDLITLTLPRLKALLNSIRKGNPFNQGNYDAVQREIKLRRKCK